MRLKPVRRWVIRRGKVVAETTPPRTTLLGERVTFERLGSDPLRGSDPAGV